MRQPEFTWDEQRGIATCTLFYKNKKFIGFANCHEFDADMKSEKTGTQLAIWRAEIKYYKHIKNNEILPSLQALKHLYSTMKNSKKFNENSYENKRLQKQIQNYEFDLKAINHELIVIQESIMNYIKEKDKFYKKIHKYRFEAANIEASKKEIVGQN